MLANKNKNNNNYNGIIDICHEEIKILSISNHFLACFDGCIHIL